MHRTKFKVRHKTKNVSSESPSPSGTYIDFAAYAGRVVRPEPTRIHNFKKQMIVTVEILIK